MESCSLSRVLTTCDVDASVRESFYSRSYRRLDSTRLDSTRPSCLLACLPACPARGSWLYQLICRYTFHSRREGAATHPRTLRAVHSAGVGRGGFRKVDMRSRFIGAQAPESAHCSPAMLLARLRGTTYRFSPIGRAPFSFSFSRCEGQKLIRAKVADITVRDTETYDNDSIFEPPSFPNSM